MNLFCPIPNAKLGQNKFILRMINMCQTATYKIKYILFGIRYKKLSVKLKTRAKQKGATANQARVYTAAREKPAHYVPRD